MVAAAVAPGLLIGTLLGLLGGGGSVLTVPVFVYILGFAPKDAIAMSLAVVGATSAVGTFAHWRAGNVNVRVGVVFGPVAMVGAFAGARLGMLLGGDTQLAIFAGVMLTAAAFMMRWSGMTAMERPAMPAGADAVAPIVLGGLLVGLLTGLVGVGGGFLIVPTLVLIRLPMREAIGTSLLIIAGNCVVSLYGYLGHVHIVWTAVTVVTAFTLPGMAIGISLHRFVPQRALRRAFAVFLVVVATFILYQHIAPVVSGHSGLP